MIVDNPFHIDSACRELDESAKEWHDGLSKAMIYRQEKEYILSVGVVESTRSMRCDHTDCWISRDLVFA